MQMQGDFINNTKSKEVLKTEESQMPLTKVTYNSHVQQNKILRDRNQRNRAHVSQRGTESCLKSFSNKTQNKKAVHVISLVLENVGMLVVAGTRSLRRKNGSHRVIRRDGYKVSKTVSSSFCSIW